MDRVICTGKPHTRLPDLGDCTSDLFRVHLAPDRETSVALALTKVTDKFDTLCPEEPSAHLGVPVK